MAPGGAGSSQQQVGPCPSPEWAVPGFAKEALAGRCLVTLLFFPSHVLLHPPSLPPPPAAFRASRN